MTTSGDNQWSAVSQWPAEVPAETTAGMQRGRPFQPGQSGNPLGRPKGSKHKLTEQFLDAIAMDFGEHGAEAIAKVRTDDPATYLKIVRSLIPRELIMHREDFASNEMRVVLVQPESKHENETIQVAANEADKSTTVTPLRIRPV